MNKKISDIADVIDCLHTTPEYTKVGFPVTRVEDIGDKYINFNNCLKVSKSTCDFMNKKYTPKIGDIVITRVGSFGRMSYIASNEKFCLGQNISIIHPHINSKFLYYYLNSPFAQKFIYGNSNGSSYKSLSLEQINNIPFCADNLNLEKIGSLLDYLDLKINNNNKINTELESMAKTLYDYWFLQFEFPNAEGKPYKSSGGKMVYDEKLKREIPEGWKVKHLKDLLYLGNDEKYDGDNINTLDLSVMPSNSISLNQINESKKFDTNLFKMKKFDILFGSIRPYLKKGGIAPCDGAFTGTVYCFRCYNDALYNYALITLCSDNMFDYAYKNSKGSKMPVIGSDRILDYPIPYDENLIKKFNFFDIKNIITSNVMQNQELASLRDFLLPLLMNGQVTFKD